MKVYKFGGASVKDADGVRNLANVLKAEEQGRIFLVVSAMAKTTNAMEKVLDLYFSRGDYKNELENVKRSHLETAAQLFEDAEATQSEIEEIFENALSFFETNKSPHYDFVYDQTVSCGELASSRIVSDYLNSIGLENTLLDVRDFIKTDDTYREGRIDWPLTRQKFSGLEDKKLYITQGFLGSDPNWFTTTLGREGSDYTAAIIANCLHAESLTIWKDVPGVLNGDPRYFENTVLLKRLSFEESIELAYYGASVIHPKTMQPLWEKRIPFFVKSFLDPSGPGTCIGEGSGLEPRVPCFILKTNQTLLTLTSKDNSLISEAKISELFNKLDRFKIKVNLMQNSALTVSLCVEDKFGRLNEFIADEKGSYEMEIQKNVSLYTVRHFDESLSYSFFKGEEILRQIIKNTLQIVAK